MNERAQGVRGMAEHAIELRLVPAAAPFEGRTTIVERGPYRVIVGEHPEAVYLMVANGCGGKAMFADPVAALEIASALVEAASKALETQFTKQMEGR